MAVMFYPGTSILYISDFVYFQWNFLLIKECI